MKEITAEGKEARREVKRKQKNRKRERRSSALKSVVPREGKEQEEEGERGGAGRREKNETKKVGCERQKDSQRLRDKNEEEKGRTYLPLHFLRLFLGFPCMAPADSSAPLSWFAFSLSHEASSSFQIDGDTFFILLPLLAFLLLSHTLSHPRSSFFHFSHYQPSLSHHETQIAILGVAVCLPLIFLVLCLATLFRLSLIFLLPSLAS